MIEFDGTYNQVIKGQHGKMGGALVVFEGHPQLLVGGFNYNLEHLPAPGEVLPCGTPVYCDEAHRTIAPVITARVASVSGTRVTVEDFGFGETAISKGMHVGLFPEELSDDGETTVANAVEVVNKDGLVITLASAINGLKAGDILVVGLKSPAIGVTSYLIYTPNAITPYDVVRSADAVSVDGDGMIGNDRPLLERRMPPYNDMLKAAVQANGHKLTFSNRK